MAGRRVDTDHLVQQDGDVLLVPKNGANGLGDIGRRQRCRRDLVQKRLEQVVVVTIDDRDVGWRPRQCTRSFEPAKAGADNDDMRPCGSHHSPLICPS